MEHFFNTLQSQMPSIVKALQQHLALSLMALFIAIIIALPIAIILRKHHKLAAIFLQIANVFQTIPSLALLGILIPFFGIGTTPAIIALVIYAIMPLFQNTYTGLTNIDQQYQETIAALGLSSWHSLWRIELPLAFPMILSGIKIALVMIIGTATLAALIGAGGLGTFILLGIETNNYFDLFIGASLSALLAIVFSALINLLNGTSRQRTFSLVILSILLVTFGSYSIFNTVKSKPNTIVIAGKMGAEPDILIHMYKDLIKADDPHANVVLKPNFGNTMFLYNALQNDQIDIYPEFTGTVLKSILHTNAIPKDPNKAYYKAAQKLNQKNLTYLKPMKYQNGYTLCVTAEFAQKYHLKDISDLIPIENHISAGFDTDFAHQNDGYPGLSKKYNVTFTNKIMDSSIKYKAIGEHKINLIDGYTTDAQIKKYHLVTLQDNMHFFPPYQGAPLMKTSFARSHPQVVKSLNKLHRQISTEDMQEMNYQVIIKHQKAATVAHNYLIKHHLITK